MGRPQSLSAIATVRRHGTTDPPAARERNLATGPQPGGLGPRFAAAWRTSNPVFADNAPLDLNGVGPEFAGELTRLGPAAGAALAGVRYERVRMYTAGDIRFVETTSRNGVERKFTVEPARIDEVFEANGLNHYLPQTGVRPVRIRDRMRAACREGAEFVHDTESGAKT